MPKRVFFTFDFADDLWRASVVRNRWVMDPNLDATGFWGPQFSTGSAPGREALELFIDEQLESAEVTAVLIGARTARCDHVLYAIRRTVELGRGLLGIYIDRAKNRFGSASWRGPNPFDVIKVERDGELVSLAELVSTYDWIEDDGFRNLTDWIAEARPTATRDF